jgi:protein-L-isoaspartate(D-aspartate) O-methyltransferase
MSQGDVRTAFAKQICETAGVQLASLVTAFARVPREHFLSPGPWQIAQPLDPVNPYKTTPDDRPEHIYQDVAIAIDPARQLNNGQPSAHARWMDASAPKPDESALHIGCGLGYYTAILAELVAPSGRVVAFEVDPDLASRARSCLADWPQVRVETGDGGQPQGRYDVVYVNAGATHARKEWLASLSPGGRILLPLTAHLPTFPFAHGVGFVVCAKRTDGLWPARVVSPVGIFDCVGARDERAESQLRKLLRPGAIENLQSGGLHVATEAHPQEDKCLVHVDGFCLQR